MEAALKFCILNTYEPFKICNGRYRPDGAGRGDAEGF